MNKQPKRGDFITFGYGGDILQGIYLGNQKAQLQSGQVVPAIGSVEICDDKSGPWVDYIRSWRKQNAISNSDLRRLLSAKGEDKLRAYIQDLPERSSAPGKTASELQLISWLLEWSERKLTRRDLEAFVVGED